MGLWVPPVSWDGYQSNITTPVLGTTVTAGGSAHTKNATYTELIASTSFDAYLIDVWFSDVATSGSDTATLVDIAIGAAASETVIIPNLNAGGAKNFGNTAQGGQRYLFPLYIPSGSRLSATSQAAIGGDTVNVIVKLWGNPSSPVWAGTEVIDYGTNLATSRGVDVAAGLSAAEGTAVQITASTTRSHYYIAAGVGMAGDATVAANAVAMVDVGVGAATEDYIFEDGYFSASNTEEITHSPLGVYAQIPAATRLVSRISWNSASAQSFDVILYGVG